MSKLKIYSCPIVYDLVSYRQELKAIRKAEQLAMRDIKKPSSKWLERIIQYENKNAKH